jgi:hypothetical protein
MKRLNQQIELYNLNQQNLSAYIIKTIKGFQEYVKWFNGE